jgi:DNA-binding NarL/FixJ family response regulator
MRPGPTNGSRAASPAVALIAQDSARESIAAILEPLGVCFSAFDSVEELPESFSPKAEPCSILLWSESASPAPQLELLSERATAPIVAICAELARWEVRAALAAGAMGLVLEEEMAGTLGPCLQAVQAGMVCVPAQHARQVEPPALSTREKQILGLVVMGYMNSQIAERLFLAESTVKSHLSSAFGKLGVRSRNEAVSMILDSKHGLGTGILGLGGEPLQTPSRALR